MSNIFNGFNIGLRGLQTQKTSIDITGHNIANANNEDYARQRPIHTATDPHPMPGLQSAGGAGQLGTGVEVKTIERIRDAFIEQQVREESQEKSYWEKLYQGLERVEFILNEPSDSSLKESMNLFWNSLQDLSNEPSDTAARTMVKSRGESLIATFHTLYGQLHDYKVSLNSDVGTKVEEINTIAGDIAALNKQITSISASNQVPNDLLDRRDALFNDLNELVNVKGFVDNMNGLTVSIGGMRLITGSDVNELTVDTESSTGEQYEDQVIFGDSEEEVNIKNGELKAILDLRNDEIDEYIKRLDDIAQNFAEHFNEVHKMGYDLAGLQGNDFFNLPADVDDDNVHAAATIGLSSVIAAEDGITKIAAGNYSDSPEVVTAWNVGANADDFYEIQVIEEDTDNYNIIINKNGSEIYNDTAGKDKILAYDQDTDIFNVIDDSDNYPEELNTDYPDSEIFFYTNSEGKVNLNFAGNEGSGANASVLAGTIKEDELDELNGATVMQYYEALVSTIGVNTQQANQMVDNQDALVNQLKNLAESVSGVSLDEEMANLMKYQQAYNASAKMIIKTEELIDNLMTVIR